MDVHAAKDTQTEIKSETPIQAFEPRDRNVYILGAGFSAQAGAPLIHDFLDRSCSFLDEPMGLLGEFNRAQRAPFETVFKYKREMSRAREKVQIDLDNIEELFGLVEISLRLDPTKQEISDSIALMISRTLEWTTQDTGLRPTVRIGPFPDPGTWFGQLGFSPESFQVHEAAPTHYIHTDIYTYFAALVAGVFDDPKQKMFRKDAVITFNYDLVLDSALYQVGVAPDYHLPSAVDDPNWKPSPRRCSVLKLHGSINWGVCSKCRTRLLIGCRKPNQRPLWHPRQHCAGCGEQLYLPLLVPPSWDKTGHRDILAPVWAEAVKELKNARRICVIGYSMPKSDAYFKYLLTLALAENDRLSELIVVDSGRTVHDRWKEFLEPMFMERRLDFHPEGLTGYLTNDKTFEQLARGELLSEKTHVLCAMGR